MKYIVLNKKFEDIKKMNDISKQGLMNTRMFISNIYIVLELLLQFFTIMNLKDQANYSKFLNNLSYEKGKRDGKLD